jgi:hypothetical protein
MNWSKILPIDKLLLSDPTYYPSSALDPWISPSFLLCTQGIFMANFQFTLSFNQMVHTPLRYKCQNIVQSQFYCFFTVFLVSFKPNKWGRLYLFILSISLMVVDFHWKSHHHGQTIHPSGTAENCPEFRLGKTQAATCMVVEAVEAKYTIASTYFGILTQCLAHSAVQYLEF